MKNISQMESKKDCFANCSDIDLLINLKWWFHDYWLPLNYSLQNHAGCLFETATAIFHITAGSKCNTVEQSAGDILQELYLPDTTEQFVLWFLIASKSVEWNVLSEATLLTSCWHHLNQHRSCLYVFMPFESSSSWCWTNEK